MDAAAAAGDRSDSSSSSSSDSVLIPMPLDQRHRKKLQAQLQREQEQQRGRERERDRKTAAPKNEHICVVCERGDGELAVCGGPCVSAFHIACLASDERPNTDSKGGTWLCPSCRGKTHECFHCKERGTEQAGEGDASAAAVADAAAKKGPVRKCRALSCGKFYHLDCITQFPLARIAGTHFICPLHTCAVCGLSGAQKEAVRCVRCPVAYHASCLPAHGVRQLTTKLIICPSHELSRAPDGGDKAAITEQERSSAVKSNAGVASVKTEARASESPSKVSTTIKHGDRAVEGDHNTPEHSHGIAAVDDDVTSEASASTSSKKRDKKEKRDKKKKKKKKKKMKRKESRERLTSSQDEREDESGQGAATSGDEVGKNDADSLSRASRATSAAGDDEAAELASHRETGVSGDEKASVDGMLTATPSKRVQSPVDAESPSLAASYFESPATTKQRLEEALGKSDDELDAVDTPAKATASAVQAEIATADGAASPRVSSAADESDQGVSMKVEPPLSESIPPSSVTGPEKIGGERLNKARPSISPDELLPKREETETSSSPLRARKSPRTAEEQRPSVVETTPEETERLAVQIPTSHSGEQSPSFSSLTPNEGGISGGRMKDAVSDGEEGDDEGPGSAMTPRSRRLAAIKMEQYASGTPRGGRSGASRKKKKNKSSKHSGDSVAEGGNTSTRAEEDEAKWVQCDNCKKWRTVPQDFDLSTMPERWYCHMNTWNTDFASCEVAEEDAKQRTPQKTALPERPSLKKKSKKKQTLAMALAAGNAGAGSDGGSSSSSGSGIAKKSTPRESLGGDTPSTADDKEKAGGLSAKQIKKQEKARKKRKLTKIKDKYRELKWVQCESAQCGKWRVVPSSIDFDRLPAVWYCHLNTWEKDLAKCTAPNPPEVEAFLQKQAAKEAAAGSICRPPSKKAKPSATDSSSTVEVAAGGAGGATGTGPAGSDQPSKPLKASKAAKGSRHGGSQAAGTGNHGGVSAVGTKAESTRTSATSVVLSAAAVATGTSQIVDAAPSSRGGKSKSSSSSNTSSTTASGEVKKTVLEWAQCEKCNKWRKLPQHIKSSTLPDKWYCSMNHWDPTHAKCSIPEEVEPAPVMVGPFPNSQTWYQGTNKQTHGGSRHRKGKLSYSELLYASTGQLRKTYTPESSTLSFEYEGVTYHRDDQYKSSSMYVSQEAMEAAIASARAEEQEAAAVLTMMDQLTPRATRDDDGYGDGTSEAVDILAMLLSHTGSSGARLLEVERVATTVMDVMDLRRDWSVSDLLDGVNSSTDKAHESVSLSSLAAALGSLETKGLIERLDGDNSQQWKRRKTERESASDGSTGSSGAILYRKVPSRPLKASKCWKFGQNPLELLAKD